VVLSGTLVAAMDMFIERVLTYRVFVSYLSVVTMWYRMALHIHRR